jgi:hypothetical protein
MPEKLQVDIAIAKSLGVYPTKVNDPAFAKIVEQGPIKWAVLENGDLVAVPKTVGLDEIKHSVLSNGKPVLTAGEATIDIFGNLRYGDEINRVSGHFKPSSTSLQIGVNAFKEAGIEFKTVNPVLPPEFYWGY